METGEIQPTRPRHNWSACRHIKESPEYIDPTEADYE